MKRMILPLICAIILLSTSAFALENMVIRAIDRADTIECRTFAFTVEPPCALMRRRLSPILGPPSRLRGQPKDCRQRKIAAVSP